MSDDIENPATNREVVRAMKPAMEDDDVQRALEQKALRNVRALVDRIEADDASRTSAGRQLLLAGVGLVLGLFVVAPVYLHSRHGVEKLMAPTLERPVEGMFRSRYVISGEPTRYDAYLNQFLLQVEDYANTHYPPSIRGLYGKVEISVTLRASGEVERVEVTHSSGHDILDATAAGFIREAGPYEHFSTYSLSGVDVLTITRTFAFSRRPA